MPRTNQSDQKPFYKRRWGANEARYRTRLIHKLQRTFRIEKPSYWWAERSLGQKLIVGLSVFVLLGVGSMYAVAQWYIAKNADKPLELGTTFISSYAQYYDLDPEETMHAIIHDIGFRNLRLVSYWNEIEKTPGEYDFSDLDWQFEMAEEANVDVSLSIGLRQPRWPECHKPSWAAQLPQDEWYVHLKTFMGEVVNRYKNSPALKSYQLENEFFLEVFGKCPDFSRERLIDEFNFVKQLDPDTPVIISRSNNAVPSWPVGEPRPDKNAAAVYKRVWDANITKTYFEYPFPAWYYAFLAGGAELTTGRQTILHELQAEPWMPLGMEMKYSSIEEQDKSMNAEMLDERIEYGIATGMRTIDLWGAEWWYWRKVHHNDPSLWNVVKDHVQRYKNPQVYR